MKIVNFAYCTNVKEENGTTVIINPLTMITPYSVPTNYSFFVTFGLYDLPINESDQHISIKILSPSGGEVANENFNIPNIDIPKGEKAGVQLNIALQNVVLKERGSYKTVVTTNGVCLGEFFIEVIPNAK